MYQNFKNIFKRDYQEWNGNLWSIQQLFEHNIRNTPWQWGTASPPPPPPAAKPHRDEEWRWKGSTAVFPRMTLTVTRVYPILSSYRSVIHEAKRQNKKFLKNLDISAFHLKNMTFHIYNSSIVWPCSVFKQDKDLENDPSNRFFRLLSRLSILLVGSINPNRTTSDFRPRRAFVQDTLLYFLISYRKQLSILSFKKICFSKMFCLFKFQSEVGFCFAFVLVQ